MILPLQYESLAGRKPAQTKVRRSNDVSATTALNASFRCNIIYRSRHCDPVKIYRCYP